MAITLIPSNPDFKKEKPDYPDFLNVAEFFSDTLQGENFVGHPSTFLRLQHCTLNCVWCDTTEVWRQGNPYTFDEILDLISNEEGLVRRLMDGQHLILTGGSPLKQQMGLTNFLQAFYRRFQFLPFTEVENECVLPVRHSFFCLVSRWNNSPKLSNSGMKKELRYKPDVIREVASFEDSWFKFVIDNEDEWKEIEDDFLKPGLIRKSQIVLMPQGQTQEELSLKREWVAAMAIKHNVRYSDRLHVILWNKKTGV